MNKKLLITALLIAVSCQLVSAMPTFEVSVSMMNKAFSNVNSFVGSHKAVLGVTVASSALLVAAYKYLTRGKVWVEGNCIKFKKRTLFSKRCGSICFETPEKAIAVHKAFKGGFSRIQEIAKAQLNSSVVWNPRPMTDTEKQKFQQDISVFYQEYDPVMYDRVMKETFGKFGWV